MKQTSFNDSRPLMNQLIAAQGELRPLEVRTDDYLGQLAAHAAETAHQIITASPCHKIGRVEDDISHTLRKVHFPISEDLAVTSLQVHTQRAPRGGLRHFFRRGEPVRRVGIEFISPDEKRSSCTVTSDGHIVDLSELTGIPDYVLEDDRDYGLSLDDAYHSPDHLRADHAKVSFARLIGGAAVLKTLQAVARSQDSPRPHHKPSAMIGVNLRSDWHKVSPQAVRETLEAISHRVPTLLLPIPSLLGIPQ